jgi:type I restriction enzyme S subunit
MSWGKVKLGEICTIEKGAIGIQKAIQGEYPLVVTGEDRKSHNEFQFDCEAVIIPLVSGTGHGHASIKRLHFQTGKFALGNILCAVIPKDTKKLNAEYLFRFLDLNKEDELVARMKGMANVTLPIKEIAQIEIPLPPINKQLEFVNNYKILESQNNKLSTELTHQLTLVKKLRQQLLQDAVQGKLLPQNTSRKLSGETGSELLKKIKAEKAKLIAEKKLKKEKDLPPIKLEEIPFEIPDNWVWCRLGEICSIKGGKRVANGYKLLKEPTPHIYIRVSDMKNGTVDDSDLHYLDETMFQKIKQYTISKEDIYMTIVGGTIGKCGLIPDIFDNMNLTENAAKISPILVDKVYLWKCLDSPFCQDQFIDKTKQVGVQKMALNRFSCSLIPLPPLSEQNRIVEKLDELMQYCDNLEESIKESQAQNEKLLQQVLREALRKEEVKK